jgi:hypothetical protein
VSEVASLWLVQNHFIFAEELFWAFGFLDNLDITRILRDLRTKKDEFYTV